MSTFSLMYKLKLSQTLNDWDVEDINIIKEALNQLKNWYASFNWVFIHWYETIDELKILQRCCDKYENWNYYIKTINTVFNNIEFENANELIDWFSPIDKDITNNILTELNLEWKVKNNYGKSWYIWDDFVNIKWKNIELEPWTKYKTIFDIINETYLNKPKNELTYDELIETFKNWNYSNISKEDLIYEKIRWDIKHKLKEIRDKTWTKFFWPYKRGIVILGK